MVLYHLGTKEKQQLYHLGLCQTFLSELIIFSAICFGVKLTELICNLAVFIFRQVSHNSWAQGFQNLHCPHNNSSRIVSHLLLQDSHYVHSKLNIIWYLCWYRISIYSSSSHFPAQAVLVFVTSLSINSWLFLWFWQVYYESTVYGAQPSQEWKYMVV